MHSKDMCIRANSYIHGYMIFFRSNIKNWSDDINETLSLYQCNYPGL